MAGVTLDAKLNMSVSLSATGDIASGRAGATVSKSFTMNPGSATVDEADLLFADERSLSSSTAENLDLAGVLSSPLNQTITAAEVVAVYVEAVSGGVVLGNVTNGWAGPFGASGTYTLAEGEWAFFSSRSGWTVTAATGDLLKVAPTGTTATYKIVIVARSVAR